MTTLNQVLRELEERPDDERLLRKAGELFQKRGDDVSAAKYFLRAAAVYCDAGFELKAIAVYKQVLRLDPELIDVLATLATIHVSLGLEAEANDYFLKARNAFLKAGRRSDAIDMERRLAERSVPIGPPVARA